MSCSCDHRNLHSFPTRRSSDLRPLPLTDATDELLLLHVITRPDSTLPLASLAVAVSCTVCPVCRLADVGATVRSEEHTSELQSQSNLVCRLLLEKKKKNDDENV